MKKQILLLLFFLLGGAYIAINAQVTIGTGSPSMPGSLLQLKNLDETKDGGMNASRGLGLPRVTLIETDKLRPMYSYANAANTPTDEELTAHTGLLVYNMNSCFENRGGEQGMYVWDGSRWEPLRSQETASSVVSLYTDQDGNSFKARHFIATDGTDAGIWMLENLRAKHFVTQNRTGDDNTVVVVLPTVTSGMVTSSANPVWCYPGPASGDASDDTYLVKQPDLGILYNWAAATNSKGRGNESGANNASPNGDNTPGYKGDNAKIQGICPNGWHIPSDAEWNLLEKVIATSPQLFSRYKENESGWNYWNSAWETADNMRPNITNAGLAHGNAMKSFCQANDYSGVFARTYGQSLAAYQGGFAVLMAGFGYSSKIDDYGFISHIWSSTASSSNSAFNRIFFTSNAGVSRAKVSREYVGSVRCKKD